MRRKDKEGEGGGRLIKGKGKEGAVGGRATRGRAIVPAPLSR